MKLMYISDTTPEREITLSSAIGEIMYGLLAETTKSNLLGAMDRACKMLEKSSRSNPVSLPKGGAKVWSE
jgi:hypothetical protein